MRRGIGLTILLPAGVRAGLPYWHLQRHTNFAQLAENCVARCHLLAGFTETPGSTTRTFLSDPMHACHRAVSGWMEALGMQVSVDAIGNLRGLWHGNEGAGRERPRLLIGSHLDTVPCAGAYDGILGVCLPLAVLEAFGQTDLPFEVEVLGFSEEEGVRFRVPFFGSLAVTGRFDPALLELTDAQGATVAAAIRHFGLDPAQIPLARLDPAAFAYLEFHIEQGPVLDLADESIAAVEAIAGLSRLELTFAGSANHAGTTPMPLRRDALAGAAEWVARAEEYARSSDELVATVGKLQVLPGAANVVPGEVRASLDVRHSRNATRLFAVRELCDIAAAIAARRGLKLSWNEQLNQTAVPMDAHLVSLIENAIAQTGEVPRRMVSGAGHDAMILAEKVPSAMVFVRSIGGISHHPDEAVRLQDVEKAIRAACHLLTSLAEERKTLTA